MVKMTGERGFVWVSDSESVNQTLCLFDLKLNDRNEG